MVREADIRLEVSQDENVPKFVRLVDAVANAIAQGQLRTGDTLPSVTAVCDEFGFSRDTVFKAYSSLKERGLVESMRGKGFYVADQMQKVFVFLDTFKAYKEVLYDALTHNMPPNVIADVNFHHYNPRLFRKLIEESVGRYSKYIVMPFQSEVTEAALAMIPNDKLLVIDWNLFTSEESNVLYQDFGQSLYDGLMQVLHLIRRYREFHFLYPEFTYHPYESVEAFERFCEDNGLSYVVERDSSTFDVRADVAYISVSDRMLGRFLEQCRAKKLVLGKDVGMISYNETPMKPFVDKGITVFSTDFSLMGRRAAAFVSEGGPVRECVPSRMIIRESL